MPIRINFDNSYARLPARFFARTQPDHSPQPRILAINSPLAEELDLDIASLSSPEGADVLAGSEIPDGADPIALAYAGHQFGHFVPVLGDGRAILLGEVIDRAGVRRDIQLKGSGRTPFSRRGDGKAALGPVLREYLVSEAMAALGVPTTRSLAAVATGETVIRERPLPGAVLTRVALSHVRVGTFQYFASRADEDGIRQLADHVIERLYPEVAETENRYAALFEQVVERQARLIAHWLSVGFIHGVMNTDNMAISGETIDYGPCAFMDRYDPAMVLSSIDRAGRYAYGRQPQIAQWNLARLGECLLPLLSEDRDAAVAMVVERLSRFADVFDSEWLALCRAKIGLSTQAAGDSDLIAGLLAAMQAGNADFTLTFRRLADIVDPEADGGNFLDLFDQREAIDAWLPLWRSRLAAEHRPAGDIGKDMRHTNPAIIPRNHLVEAALNAAIDEDNLAPFSRLFEAVTHPFDPRPEAADLMMPPRDDERVLATFCGT